MPLSNSTSREQDRANANDEEAQLLDAERFVVDDSEDDYFESRPRGIVEFDFEEAPPPPVVARAAAWPSPLAFLHGPKPPRRQYIKPLAPGLQRGPSRLIDRWAPKWYHKALVLAVCLIPWALTLVYLSRSQMPVQDGFGQDVINLKCTDTLWRRKNECGLGGIDCRPFTNDSFAFRCPAKCADVQLLNPRAVGPVDVNYRPLVIGTDFYRGDSFLCASALHTGLIDNVQGGCGRVTRMGDHDNFPSSNRHGIESISFDSYFPLSFTVTKDSSFTCPRDHRSAFLAITIVSTILISLCSTSPTVFFPLFVIIFAEVAFASDPPTASYHSRSVWPDHLSLFARRILPALFVAVVLYWTVVRRTLADLDAHMEKTVLWLGGFWFGALSNYTFDWIPISRLTSHDLAQQPGAKIALAVILIILVAIIIQQIYYFWLEGRLPRYLMLYGLFIFSILVCLLIPNVELRLHHYIIALLLLPGTSMQTRPALLYQGLLLGLFVNGIARWDFDSILQTAADLRGDARFNSVLPSLAAPVITHSKSALEAVFSWAEPPAGMQGISVLVNDVERDRAFFADEGVGNFTWRRENSVGVGVKEYFRFAFLRDGRALDYTAAGTLFGNGTWREGFSRGNGNGTVG